MVSSTFSDIILVQSRMSCGELWYQHWVYKAARLDTATLRLYSCIIVCLLYNFIKSVVHRIMASASSVTLLLLGRYSCHAC